MNKEKALERLAALENEAKELRKIIEVPEKQKISAEDYLKDILSKCIGKVTEGYITWYIDDQWIFQQDLKNKYLWCYYYKVWKVFEDEYDMQYDDIQRLQKNVVGKALNCKEFTPDK